MSHQKLLERNIRVMTYLCDLVLLLILFEQPVAHAPDHFLAVPPVNIMPSYSVCPQTEEILHQI